MSNKRISTIMRAAIWRANKKRCFYCQEPIQFCDLEIDHLIPKATSGDRVQQLVDRLGLETTFDVDDLCNLVPTHGSCNSKKSDTEFTEHNLRYYLELWARKIPRVKEQLERLQRHSRNESILIELVNRVENGDLTISELVTFLEQSTQKPHKQSTEPIVVAFGLSIEDIDWTAMPGSVSFEYAHLCDWLGKQLMHHIRRQIPCLSVMVEDSRNGESFGIRIAFWNFDINHLERMSISPWQVLEVSYYSEIYSDSWEGLFTEAAISTYHTDS